MASGMTKQQENAKTSEGKISVNATATSPQGSQTKQNLGGQSTVTVQQASAPIAKAVQAIANAQDRANEACPITPKTATTIGGKRPNETIVMVPKAATTNTGDRSKDANVIVREGAVVVPPSNSYNLPDNAIRDGSNDSDSDSNESSGGA